MAAREDMGKRIDELERALSRLRLSFRVALAVIGLVLVALALTVLRSAGQPEVEERSEIVLVDGEQRAVLTARELTFVEGDADVLRLRGGDDAELRMRRADDDSSVRLSYDGLSLDKPGAFFSAIVMPAHVGLSLHRSQDGSGHSGFTVTADRATARLVVEVDGPEGGGQGQIRIEPDHLSGNVISIDAPEQAAALQLAPDNQGWTVTNTVPSAPPEKSDDAPSAPEAAEPVPLPDAAPAPQP